MTETVLINKTYLERLNNAWNWFKKHFFNIWFFFLPGAVSKVHQQEATEKYWILWRDVEILYNTEVNLLGKGAIGNLPRDPPDIDEFVKDAIEKIDEGPESTGNGGENNSKLNESRSKLKLLLFFYKILVKDRSRLTRREGHLNMLWRDMTFIRTRMLTDGISSHEKLPFQLDYCMGEAARIGLQDDPEIKELVHEAAVELDNTDSPQAQISNNRSLRKIVRIITCLNDRRLKRFHDQRMNKLMYQAAFLILLILSCILLHNHEQVLGPKIEDNIHKQIDQVENVEKNAIKTFRADQINSEADIIIKTDSNKNPRLMEKLFCFFAYSFELCKNYMVVNPLFFIFFSGLIGGFLSTVMRFGKGSKDLMPGEDAYYAWYVFTKPFVGALGAAILYVIVRADFVPVEVFSDKFLGAIKDYPVGAKGFAFGCIMGFSERVIMPDIK
ncbi:MAG: hypothetical protein FP814_03325 [Desulfobacterium sp.]|nr:hypothetical protein [Desulfobacterium sp.]MBU3950358.1 hypothetical protein [Pseudomonadota bacterium]MBU4037269.1 hypothetical protein [Pseudomonadota bacterium]